MGTQNVVSFYKDIPFNFSNDEELSYQSILNSNQILEYTDLHFLLRERKNWIFKPKINNVIEFGCGTGWLTNTISHYYGKNLTSIDFTSKALDIAKKVSKKLNVYPKYENCNIFDYKDSELYDLVISMGVLHHTIDCKKAFKKIATLVKPGGYLYVGLYHLYGRRPMLNFLQSYCRWHGENAAFNLFRKMNSSMTNKEHCYSWFRDQVLHPLETQHTYEEILRWISDMPFKIKSTSINNYKKLLGFSNDDLFNLEKNLEKYSFKKNVIDLKFNPGYFTVCLQKDK